MRILITGGAGYIGSKLVEQLSQENQLDEIVIYDNLSLGSYAVFFNTLKDCKTKINFIQGDILDSRKIKKSLDGVDVVIHLAAKVTTPFSGRGSDFFEQVNHWGTAELCYALENSSVKKAIYMSSASVYGAQDSVADIDTIPTPNTAYGFSKIRGEAHFERMQEFMDTTIIRCANTYGHSPSTRFDSVINNFLFKAQQKQIININGNGNQTRAFVPIQLVSEVVKEEILNLGTAFKKFNLCNKNLSVNEIVDTLKLIFPDLQLIYVNQHLTLRNQALKIEDNYAPKSEGEFLNELKLFRESFAF